MPEYGSKSLSDGQIQGLIHAVLSKDEGMHEEPIQRYASQMNMDREYFAQQAEGVVERYEQHWTDYIKSQGADPEQFYSWLVTSNQDSVKLRSVLNQYVLTGDVGVYADLVKEFRAKGLS